MSEFKYALGDLVVTKSVMEAVRLEMASPKQYGRTTPFRIIERISRECVAGTQFFYGCETWDGNTGTFAEGSLLAFQLYFDEWVKWFNAKATEPTL